MIDSVGQSSGMAIMPTALIIMALVSCQPMAPPQSAPSSAATLSSRNRSSLQYQQAPSHVPASNVITIGMDQKGHLQGQYQGHGFVSTNELQDQQWTLVVMRTPDEGETYNFKDLKNRLAVFSAHVQNQQGFVSIDGQLNTIIPIRIQFNASEDGADPSALDYRPGNHPLVWAGKIIRSQ